MTFSNCHFELTNIVVLEGASVKLTGCTFTCNEFSVVFAHACGTCASVESCSFIGGFHPVSVVEGASVTVTGSTFNRPQAIAMVVRDKGSLLTAENCRVQGAEPAAAQSAQAVPRGALVSMGARLELSSTEIANVRYGVAVCQKSVAVLTSCHVAAATALTAVVPSGKIACIRADRNSFVELSRCVLGAKNKKGADILGVYAGDSSVKLQECRVLRSVGGVTLYRSQGVLVDYEFATLGRRR